MRILAGCKADAALLLVIPAQAGIQWRRCAVVAKIHRFGYWIPACAGMTHRTMRGGGGSCAKARMPDAETDAISLALLA
jgi:hypothetical protein